MEESERHAEAGLGEDAHLLLPMSRTTPRFWLLAGTLLAIVFWGLFAWSTQLRRGLFVTGLNVPVYWGLYITNFVFFIGISHAGTLISAILRLAHAEWRRPITRAAEVITVLVLFFGARMRHPRPGPAGPRPERASARQLHVADALGRRFHHDLPDREHASTSTCP